MLTAHSHLPHHACSGAIKRHSRASQQATGEQTDRHIADGSRIQFKEAGSKSEEAGYLNMQTGTRSIDTQVAMLDGKG